MVDHELLCYRVQRDACRLKAVRVRLFGQLCAVDECGETVIVEEADQVQQAVQELVSELDDHAIGSQAPNACIYLSVLRSCQADRRKRLVEIQRAGEIGQHGGEPGGGVEPGVVDS